MFLSKIVLVGFSIMSAALAMPIIEGVENEAQIARNFLRDEAGLTSVEEATPDEIPIPGDFLR